MSRYSYFDSEFPEVTVSASFDTKRFGELELVGTLMDYRNQKKDFWDKIGIGGSITSAAAFWNGKILFGACDRNFYCLNEKGKELWRFSTGGVINCEASVHDGIVFFGSQDRNVYAVDCASGKLKWKFTTGDIVPGTFLIKDGLVFAVSYDGNVYAIEEETGKEAWRITTPFAQTCVFEKDGILFFGYRGGIFYAYDIQLRKHLWEFKESYREISIWNGCFWGENVYIGSFDGNVFALERRTGKVQWRFPVADFAYAPSAGPDGIYFGSRDLNVYKLDPKTGRMIWKFYAGGIAVPIESEGKAYFGSYSNNVYCLDSVTGKQIWSFKTNGFVTFVRVSEGRLYAGSWDCNMYCLDAETGELIWKFRTSMGTPAMLEPPESVSSGERVVLHLPEKKEDLIFSISQQSSNYGQIEIDYAATGKNYLKRKGDYV